MISVRLPRKKWEDFPTYIIEMETSAYMTTGIIPMVHIKHVSMNIQQISVVAVQASKAAAAVKS